ncbi:MAG TPA: DUF6599 family protein [Blastocatellia bacterium]|nr:DUF6599 family protein [Blastocatellia bacterium]
MDVSLSKRQPSPLFRTFGVLFSILLLAASGAQGQIDKELLPDRLGENWRATNPERVFGAERLSSLPDANVLREYGLQRFISRVYANGKTKSTVEVFELNLIPNAYGLFTFNRGQEPPNSREFYHGRYVVRVSNTAADANFDQQIFEALKPNLIGGEGELPSLPLHLPETDKIKGSEKYIMGPAALTRLNKFRELKDAINFGEGVELTTADYSNGGGQMSLIIVEYYTPQLASDVHARIQDLFNALPQTEKERRLIKRVGNYIVAISSIQDRPAAEKIAGQIKYQKKIYWAGKKFTDIPLEFRPADPLATEETTRTVQIMARSFYWMGAMIISALLIGLFAGVSLFSWKRYRRRKRGMDDLFSDAGGTVRLNLDD